MKKRKKKQLEDLKQHINKSIQELKKVIRKRDFDILVCDEILNLINVGFIKESDLISYFGKIKSSREIVLTGRNKPKRLTRIADYVTELRLIKHPFQKGILARRSIEF